MSVTDETSQAVILALKFEYPSNNLSMSVTLLTSQSGMAPYSLRSHSPSTKCAPASEKKQALMASLIFSFVIGVKTEGGEEGVEEIGQSFLH